MEVQTKAQGTSRLCKSTSTCEDIMKHTDETVIGYRPQPQYKVDLVNTNKEIEGRIMNVIASLAEAAGIKPDEIDARMLAIAKTNIEQGFMWLNRAIFQPAAAPTLKSSMGAVYGKPTDDIGRNEAPTHSPIIGPLILPDDPRSDADKLADAEHDRQLSGEMEAHLANKAYFGT
jgi:hypothetical protein